MEHASSEHEPIRAQAAGLLARLRSLGRGETARLAVLSGVADSTLREMRRETYWPRPLDNLAALERGLAALEAERSDPPGQSPEPGGDRRADGAGGHPDDDAAAAQGDHVAAGAADGSHDGDHTPANAVRRLEINRENQTCADPAEAGSRRAGHPARSVPANGPDGHSPLRPGDAGPGDQPARSVR